MGARKNTREGDTQGERERLHGRPPNFISRANCCWKSKWISLLIKMLNNAGHIDAKLIDFSAICQQKKKKTVKSAVFYWLFLGEVFPWNFPWNRPIFLWICPWKSIEIWLFSAKMPRNRPIFLWILTFLRRNRPIFPWICYWKSREILLFFPRNIRSPEWGFLVI